MEHSNTECPICHEIKWTKAPHSKYILSELGSNGVTTGGVPVDAYLCTSCRYLKLIHS